MNSALNWPQRPTCHDSAYEAGLFGTFSKPEWRTDQGLRYCAHCGSIHPQTLLEGLQAGARLERADWKYGWPHKFYVDGLPNPNQGQLVSRSGGSGPIKDAGAERVKWEERAAKVKGAHLEWSQDVVTQRWNAEIWEPDGATVHAKWYNLHLTELEEPSFAALAAIILQQTGVEFTRDEVGVKWKGKP